MRFTWTSKIIYRIMTTNLLTSENDLIIEKHLSNNWQPILKDR